MTKQSTQGYLPTKRADLSKLPKIKGYDFDKQFDFDKFLAAYSTTGIQASRLGTAIEIVKAMRREKAAIFLSYTSNMASSGIRDIIAHLAKRKKVSVIVTAAGGIEEDFMKCFDSFSLGDFKANPAFLNEQGVNRIGNIFVPNDFYALFEIEMRKVLSSCHNLQKKTGRPLCTSEIIHEMGHHMESSGMENREQSMVYWAYKNKIPVFSPSFTDGSIGDMMFFYRQQHKDFFVDISQDMDKIVSITLNADKTGVICLGGGSSKHYALNAQIFRDGCDFAVYINSHGEEDASDSGADTSEAVTWTKIKVNAPQVKVHGDASIIFPLLVAGALRD